MSVTRTPITEHVLTVGDRAIGVLGHVGSSFTLAWLAAHRGRLRSLFLGGHRLTLLVIWDQQGRAEVPCSAEDVAAIQLLTYGPEGPR